MKNLDDLHNALKTASTKSLIEDFRVHEFFLDIVFSSERTNRRKEETQKILKLRDYIKTTYQDVHAVDYMPLLNQLRLYGNFKSITQPCK